MSLRHRQLISQTAAIRLATISVVLGLGGAMAVLLLATPVGDVLKNPELLPDWGRSLTRSQLALVLAAGPLLAFFLPRSIVYVLGGVLLGFLPGLIWAQISTTIGSYALFLAVRFIGRDWARAKLGSHPRLQRVINADLGFWGVFWVRQLPAPNMAVNALLGLSRIGHAKYVAASFIAFLPEGVPAVLAGTGVRDLSFAQSVPLLLTGIALIWLIGRVLRVLSTRFVPDIVDPAPSGIEPSVAGTLGPR